MNKFAIIFLAASSLFATTVTSITCSGQTATVNATAHGLVASQGFSLCPSGGCTASTGFIGAAQTVGANSFTFTPAGGQACNGLTTGYITVQPLRQIIPMQTFTTPNSGSITYIDLFWHTTVYPNPQTCNLPVTSNGVTTNTGCPQSVWSNATAVENAALNAGVIVEQLVQNVFSTPSAAAFVVVSSNVGTVTATGTYTVGSTVDLAGSTTAALNGPYTVASIVSGGFTVATSGVSNGTYNNSNLIVFVPPTATQVQAAFQAQYSVNQALYANYLLAGGYCYYGAVVGYVLCASGGQ